MARTINKLSARLVATINETGTYSDGGGLYLQVSKFGTKSWVYRFKQQGKVREMGLGSTSTISLAAARIRAGDCRKQVSEGHDPIEQRKRQRSAQEASAARQMTFRECANSYIRNHQAGWKNAKHAAQWESTLETYVYPIFGRVPFDSM